MKTLLCVLLVVLVPPSVFSVSATLVHMEQVPGTFYVAGITPIVDRDGELIGMIYYDAYSNPLIIVDLWAYPGRDTIPLQNASNLNTASTVSPTKHRNPDAGVICFLDATDTLRIYGAGEKAMYATVANGVLKYQFIAPEPYTDTFPVCWALSSGPRFVFGSDGEPESVVFGWTATCGSTYPDPDVDYRFSTTECYSLDMQRLLYRNHETSTELGYIYDGAVRQSMSFQNSYRYFDDYIGEEDIYWASRLLITQSDSDTLFLLDKPWSFARDILVGDFSLSFPNDEVIYRGYNVDLADTAGDYGEYAACYNFATGSPVELWRYSTTFSNMTFSYVFPPACRIAGIISHSVLGFLDYRTGIIADTVYLERGMNYKQFFETGHNPTSLNLVGKMGDTLFIYRFDALTALEEHSHVPLPSTFTVSNPYPNPFNASTSIELALPENGRISVRVLNLLGQQVAVVADKELAAGTHTFTWDGKDSHGRTASSGVYFFAIKNAGNMVTRKMMLLK